MAEIPNDIVQEYVVPPGATAVRIEVESGGSSGHSNSSVTLEVRPGATVRLRFFRLPSRSSSETSGSLAPPD
jgi:hypothetical protein